MSATATLTIEIGPNRGKVYKLADDAVFYIGRDQKCDLSIPSGAVTRVHCKIEGRKGGFLITDLNSRLGTFVNEEKLKTRPLRNGDVIVVGSNRIRFDAAEPAPPAKEKPPRKAPAPPEELVKLRIVEPDTSLGVFFYSPRDTAARGQKLGHVEIVEPVGKGRRCVVYQGRDTNTDQPVAVKVLRTKYRRDEDVLRWFTKGAKRSGTMRHVDVVAVLGGGRHDDVLCMVLELMHENAFQRFRHAPEEGLPAVRQALQAVTRVCRALEFGCQQKRLHGGVRPAKVLFDKTGEAKLSGLGFNNRPSGPGLKEAGPLKPYIAPEVLAEGNSRDIRGDIYSLGATFFYMLAGQPPELDKRGRASSPQEFNKAVPDSLIRIVEKMLAPNPSGRYENHAHLMHDLRWALRGEVWHRA